MTAHTQGTLFDLEATLRARLRPEGMEAAQVRRIVRQARRRLDTLERIRRGFVVDASERGVVAIHPGARGEAAGTAARRFAEQGREELLEYVDGRRSFFSVPVDLTPLPEFQRRVLEESVRIPFGETRSYSFLADRIGNAGAARAVGTALGRNPVPFIVPCHRVLRGDATLGGYGFGLAMKEDLLELERTTPVLEGCTTTRILCRVGCPALGRARDENRVVFAGVDDARSVGYRPCRVCRPDAA
jgi:methylated-DNA-[protein]-cysteine S-methyltransferase